MSSGRFRRRRPGAGSGCRRAARWGSSDRNRDTTALLWRMKRAVYARSRLTIIVPSRWMLELARASPLLSRFEMHRIPHGVETDVFRPLPKEEARRRLGLPEGRPLGLFRSEPRHDGPALAHEARRLRAFAPHDHRPVALDARACAGESAAVAVRDAPDPARRRDRCLPAASEGGGQAPARAAGGPPAGALPIGTATRRPCSGA